MKSTFVRDDGTRLHVEPSHTLRNVRLWVPHGDECELVTIPAELASAVAQAIVAAAGAIAQADRLTTAEGS